MLRFLKVCSLVGCLAFAGAFVAVTAAPGAIERQLRGYVVERVKAELLEQFPAITAAASAEGLLGRLAAQARRLGQVIEGNVPDLLGGLLARLCKHDCGAEAELAAAVRDFFSARLREVGLAIDRVEAFGRGRYDAFVSELVRELQIFTATTALLFLLAFLALRRPAAPRALVLLGVVLVATALGAAAIYLFGQDWLTTILFGQYFGLGYLVVAGLVAGALADCAFNRGRALGSLAGAVAGLLPS